jgi:hypothetical protein
LIYNFAIYTVVHFYSNFWRFCQSNSAERNESGDPRRDAALRRSGASCPRACACRVAPRRLSVWDPHNAARPEVRMPRFRASSRLEGRARTCRLLAPRRAGPSPRRTPAVVLHAARVPTRSGPPRPPWLLRSNRRVPIKGRHSLYSCVCALSRPWTPPPAPSTPRTTRSLLRPFRGAQPP